MYTLINARVYTHKHTQAHVYPENHTHFCYLTYIHSHPDDTLSPHMAPYIHTGTQTRTYVCIYKHVIYRNMHVYVQRHTGLIHTLMYTHEYAYTPTYAVQLMMYIVLCCHPDVNGTTY